MKKWMAIIALVICSAKLMAQVQAQDTVQYATVFMQKDSRIDVLGEKMYAYNAALAKNIRSGKGYRLMLLSTNDRNLAMQTRAKLLQLYPEEKVYMVYQNPFIKLKMGNFEDKGDAENFKKQLLRQKIVPGNIYLLPENIEIKPVADEEEN